MDSVDNIKLFFLLPEGKTKKQSTQDMQDAYKLCEDHHLTIKWAKEESLINKQTTRCDVFVFQEFSGKLFKSLSVKSCVRMVGPRCLITCLRDGMPIPDASSPVFTTAMSKLFLTSTGFDKGTKEELITKIRHMGGVYFTNLRECVTHVVTKHVINNKCQGSKKKGIQLMTLDWVNEVYEASLKREVHATDEEFQKFRCLLLHGVIATSTNLRHSEKNTIQLLIEKNGGKYQGIMDTTHTNLLLVRNPKGEKFKCAQENNISSVSPDWLYDTVKEGEIMPFEDYVITPNACSTFVNDESKFNPDFSSVSSVFGEKPGNLTHIDETINMSVSAETSVINQVSACTKELVAKRSGEWEYLELLEKLDIMEAKKAGSFLDGCKVYLSGFNPDQTEKLRRVLNGGGATRFNEISDSLTHVIIGKFVSEDMKQLTSATHRCWPVHCCCRPHVVTVSWLLESIKQRCAASEEQFSFFEHRPPPVEPPSPLSKKGVALLQKTEEITIPTFPPLDFKPKPVDPTEPEAGEDLIHQYLHSQPGEETKCDDNPDPTSSHSSGSEADPTHLNILEGVLMEIIGFDSSQKEELVQLVTHIGGKVAEEQDTPTYAISMPVVTRGFRSTASEQVNFYWLNDCAEEETKVPIKYFHRPIEINLDSLPLKDCVITLSSYSGREREFLMEVAEALGAVNQQVFARTNQPAKDIFAATHLVCPERGSNKFKAAIKWKLPVVNHEWLLACARGDKRVSEKPYLVADSNVSSSSGSVSSRTDIQISTTKIMTETRNSGTSSKHLGTSTVALARVASDSDTPGQAPEISPMAPPRTPVESTRKTLFSQETPLRFHRECDAQTTPQGPSYIATPETPYGQFNRSNPSPECRKNWKRWMETVPDFDKEVPLSKKRRESTPLSELKRRCWAMILDKPQDSEQMQENMPLVQSDESSSLRFDEEGSLQRTNNPAEEKCTTPYFVNVEKPLKDTLVTPSKYTPLSVNKTGHSLKPPSSSLTLTTPSSDTSHISSATPTRPPRTPVRTTLPEPHSRVSTPAESLLGDTPSKTGSFEILEGSSGVVNPPTKSLEALSNTAKLPGFHTQLERLNEVLTANKPEANSMRRKKCTGAEVDKTSGNPSTSGDSSDHQTFMGLEVPSEIAVSWEYRQHSNTKRGHSARFGAARVGMSRHRILVLEGNHCAQGSRVQIHEGPQRTQSQGDSQDVNTKQRVFVLSSIESNQAREHYASIIVALGGQVSDKPSFDPATTHLVCDRPVRSEKLLANIAAGNWVLHTSYLFKSHEEGHFLPEEQFEWGNPDSSAVLSHIKQDNHIALLAKAVHRWRVKLSRAPVGVGAFSGMRVLVNVGKDRGDQFKRLILAGGGQVVSLSDWQTATMCLVDPSKVSLDKPISLASFATHNIPCVPTLFLNDYLVMDTPPSMSESAIPQYKERQHLKKNEMLIPVNLSVPGTSALKREPAFTMNSPICKKKHSLLTQVNAGNRDALVSLATEAGLSFVLLFWEEGGLEKG
uniref:BRCT domain-containing protein n=1 Tax=Timema bartmani TaxID=61472 RepID=A0A7R9EMK0_9NEOP|nr:unnamed protein product [Timema bartmani]